MKPVPEMRSPAPQLDKPTVAIFVEPLLSPTMTFVRAQAAALRNFAPLYVSPQRSWPTLELPPDRIVAICGKPGGNSPLQKLKQLPLKVFGNDPLFFRRIARFHPVLVHAHFGPAALTALPLARFLRVPLIATFHGFDATMSDEATRKDPAYRHRVYLRRKHILKRDGALFIAVSRFIERQLLEQGFASEKIALHYTGIDTGFFHPDDSVVREPLVLFVARLTEKKGCEYLIRAMAEVQSVEPHVDLVLIGDGPLRPSLERMAQSRLRKFQFLGAQPPEIVRKWMNRARVFSVPSVRAVSGDGEGFGMVFAEAQAMKLPVASFDSGGVPEAVAHGETGLLASERDSRSLAQNILLLLQNEALWQRMSVAGHLRVRSLFNLRTQTPLLESLYHRVLGWPPLFAETLPENRLESLPRSSAVQAS
jgi:glycosyltransferase involved in cell wall biosynthesis